MGLKVQRRVLFVCFELHPLQQQQGEVSISVEDEQSVPYFQDSNEVALIFQHYFFLKEWLPGHSLDSQKNVLNIHGNEMKRVIEGSD